jgi:hypothetical protein
VIAVHVNRKIDDLLAKASNDDSENAIESSMRISELKAWHLLERSFFVLSPLHVLPLTLDPREDTRGKSLN